MAPKPHSVSGPRGISLKVRLGAAVVTAAVIGAVVFVAIPSNSPKSAYKSAPPPCFVVSLATLARYLPNPTGIPEILPANDADQALNHANEAGTCKWSSTGGGEDRTLVVTAITYGPPSGVTAAEQAYNASVASLGCRCRAVSVSTRPVTGLGDQAEGFFITPGLGATVVTAPNASSPGANLIVRSSNAGIYLDYAITTTATGAALPADGSAAELAWMVSVARDILAALARPEAVPSVIVPAPAGIAPVSNEPRYTGLRDPCPLVTPATLAKYAHGASVLKAESTSSPGVRQLTCTWGRARLFVSLTLIVFTNSENAGQFYLSDAKSFSQSDTTDTEEVTVTGSVWMPDLGEDGVAILQTWPGAGESVQLFTWSGNVVISLWLNDYSYSAPAPDPTELLTAGVGIARDILADLPVKRLCRP